MPFPQQRAARNLPHAYWGLGTAGFPEARQVQRECEAWMTKQFSVGKDEKSSVPFGRLDEINSK